MSAPHLGCLHCVICNSNRLYSLLFKVRKRSKIKNRYNQVPHLIQDTNRKVTTSQLDITNESQEVSPFPAGDHKASIIRRARMHRNNINDQQKNVSKNILLEGYDMFAKYTCQLICYSKTCAKRPLKHRQNKDLKDKW